MKISANRCRQNFVRSLARKVESEEERESMYSVARASMVGRYVLSASRLSTGEIVLRDARFEDIQGK